VTEVLPPTASSAGTLTWKSVVGRTYTVWTASELNGPWTAVHERVGDGTVQSFPLPLSTEPRRFVRVTVTLTE